MAHDPSLGYADYFAAGGGGGSASTLVPDVDAGQPELYGLHQSGGLEMFRGRGLVPATAPAQSKAALVDDDGSSTIQFVLGEQQQHRQMSQAPLSLSLHRSAEAASSLMLHHQIGGGVPRQHQQPAPAAWMQGAWHLRGSRFLLPTQRLLHEFCSLPVESTNNPAEPPKPSAQENGGGSSSSASWTPSTQIQTMDTAELQRLKAKLYTLLEEVDRRYRRYCEQMRAVAGSFEAMAGERSSAVYTKLASRTISRHFRSLRDGVVAQIQAVGKALGEKDTAVPGMTKGETPRLRVLDQCLRQHKAYQAGMLESQSWRPQRGLPERAVSILRAWLFEHFLHPYPSDVDKHILARQTGLSRSQVSNWFINARVRLWKPMVEEMYSEEMKDQGGSGQSQVSNLQNPNPSNYTSEGGGNDEDGGGEQKPTRAQLLHDAGSLASVVSIGSGAGRIDHQNINFGMMDHLDFHVYEAAGGQGFGGGSAGGVSLTLGLQQHSDSHGGVNVAAFAESPSSAVQGGATEFLFIAGEQQMGGAGGGVHSAHGHHSQFRAGMDGDAESHYRGLSATGFQVLHDLAG